MDKIIISDLLVRAIIGINDSERINEQDILINITLITDTRQAGLSDKLTESVNYRTVSKAVIAHTQIAKRLTVEALAEDIAAICLDQPRVQSVTVRVEKPGAVRYARSVGVEITREPER
ncbi:MAG: dihydroneopterin aldolase [Anaerolineaceae bacterium]|nr:dihydroneopterin aldolase [Anaerolineaceae bacterium]MBN2677232.1 dihydroneopterin aldolase [Anaerolineaceae bacterium]